MRRKKDGDSNVVLRIRTNLSLIVMVEGSCDISLVYNLSRSCVEDPYYCDGYNSSLVCNCYPFGREISMVAGVWCLANAVTGLTGNLLTLLAIPYAKAHNRFGVNKEWDATTLFVMNLAFSDLLYCLISLPMYAVQYLYQRWPLSHSACVAFAAVRYINAFADWMSLGFIALGRCVGTLRPPDKQLAGGKGGIAIIAGIWIYAIGLVSLVLTEQVGVFGYNCRIGKCDFIQVDESSVEPHQLLYGIAFSVPCAMILVSYILIWFRVRYSSKLLRRLGVTDETEDQLRRRDLRMTWTLLLICFCYLIFVMPIAVLNMADPTAEMANLHLMFFCIYWFQYSLNFVVYALSSDQYRRAYGDFLRRLWLSWKRCCCCCCDISGSIQIYMNSKRVVVRRGPESSSVAAAAAAGVFVAGDAVTVSVGGRRRVHSGGEDSSVHQTRPSIFIFAKRTRNIFVTINNETSYHSYNQAGDNDQVFWRQKTDIRRMKRRQTI